MFLDNDKNSSYKLKKIIGSPITDKFKGSSTYFIKDFRFRDDINFPTDAKGIFELHTDGLLLRIFKSAKSWMLAIPFQDILKLESVSYTHLTLPTTPYV